MKYVALALMLCAALCIGAVSSLKIHAANQRASDSYIRNRVFLLKSKMGSCSAIQIKAPSNKIYILSAAHCRALVTSEGAALVDENRHEYKPKLVDVSVETDLLLLEAVDGRSINVAKSAHDHEKIHTLSHGHGLSTYRTDGELIEERPVMRIPVSPAEPELYDKCMRSQDQLMALIAQLTGECSYVIRSVLTTAMVMPGSSGGAALNASGELIGIISNSDGYYSGLVPLHDIQDFLKYK